MTTQRDKMRYIGCAEVRSASFELTRMMRLLSSAHPIFTANRALEKSKTRRCCTRYARRKKTTLVSSRFRKTRRRAHFVLCSGCTRTNLAVNGLCQKCARKYRHFNFKRFTGACRPCRNYLKPNC